MPIHWTFEGLLQTRDRGWGTAFQSSVRWNVRWRVPQRQAWPPRDSEWLSCGLALSQGVSVGGVGWRWVQGASEWLGRSPYSVAPAWLVQIAVRVPSSWHRPRPLKEGWNSIDWAATPEISAPACVFQEQEEALSLSSSHWGRLCRLLSETWEVCPNSAASRSKPSPPASPRIPLKNRPSGGLALAGGALFRPFLGLLCLNKRLLGPKHRCSFGNEKSN